MLLQEIFQTPFSNNHNKKKRKEKPTGRRHARNTHVTQTGSSRIFKRLVPVDYSCQSKKKYQEPFILLVQLQLCQFPNSFASFLLQTSNLLHSSLHLTTWSPRVTSRDLYLRCRSLASRAKRSFHFGPPKTNGNSSKLSLFWLHNLEKTEKNYQDMNTTVSFSVLRCLRLVGYLIHITAHERMHLLSVNTKEGGTQNKTHVLSCVLMLCIYS